MKKPKWLNINLAATIILLLVAFIAYDLIFEGAIWLLGAIAIALIWLFEGLKSLVWSENRWWTLLLYIALVVVAMKVKFAQDFVTAVIDKVRDWFLFRKKKSTTED